MINIGVICMPMRYGKSICETCGKQFEWARGSNAINPRFCCRKCWHKTNAPRMVNFNEQRFQYKKATENEKIERKKILFNKKVIIKDGCWDWKGNFAKNGYAILHVYHNGKICTKSAHRVSFEIHKGSIPNGMNICHRCDNKRCTNPDHLWLGTTQNNIDDKVRKGRQNVGENRYNSKFKDDDIREIRKMLKLGVSGANLARKYNVSRTVITYIKQGKTWKHVV